MNLFQTITGKYKGFESLSLKKEEELFFYELEMWLSDFDGFGNDLVTKERTVSCLSCRIEHDRENFTHKMKKYSHWCDKCLNKFIVKRRAEREANMTPEKKAEKARKEAIQKAKREEARKRREREKEKRRDEREIRDREVKDREKLYRAEKELHRYYYFEEHGIYPTSSKSDNNVIYVWQDTNRDNTYKIGISSKRVGTKRIYQVAVKANMKAKILHYEEVEDALSLEKELLKYGEAISFDRKFDGATEFRHLTDDDLINIEALISIYKITY